MLIEQKVINLYESQQEINVSIIGKLREVM